MKRVAMVIVLGAALLMAAPGCSSSGNLASNPDAGEDATSNGAGICQGGCCFAADACPAGCYIEQVFEADGSAMPLSCGNGIAVCGGQGAAWSFGEPTNNCAIGTPVYVDGGPDGALCCATEADSGTVDLGTEAGDAGADSAIDSGPLDAGGG